MVEIEITPEYLRRDGRNLNAAGDQLSEAVQQATNAVAGIGQAFGGDEIGMIIGVTHDLVSQRLTELFAEATLNLEADGTDLRSMADRHDVADEQIREDTGSVQRYLEA